MKALLGDCGGTFSRFALLENGQLSPIKKLKNKDFASLPALIKSLNINAEMLVLAVAGADDRNSIEFTNYPFVADRQELLNLGFKTVALMNDFVPLSMALSTPQNLKLTALQGSLQNGTRLILGAGTGLGVGALINVNGKQIPLPTETGHSDLNFHPLINRPLCAEDILSGRGFVKLYEVMGGEKNLTPEALVLSLPTNELARKAASEFWLALARYAGSLALIFLSKGGVFITGGMCQRLKNYIDKEKFAKEFCNKPSYEKYLANYPVFLIEDEDPAFIGLKSYALNRNLYAFVE